MISTSEKDVFTNGDFAEHEYTHEVIKAEALKEAATCQSAAVYYKSCSCGKVSKNENDTFTSGNPAEHVYNQDVVCDEALKEAATCTTLAVYYKSCTCGEISTNDAETFTSGDYLDHEYTHEIVKDAALYSSATCTEAAKYYKSCSCGKVSENVEDLFESGSTLSHTHTLIKSTDATCTQAATETYRCVCGDEYTQTIGDALNHDITNVTPVEKHIDGCEYILEYDCQRDKCDAKVEGKTVYHHTYVASITKPATCQENGVKTLTCECGDTKTEIIEKDETGHNWVKGEVNNGVRTDTCSICSTTKNVTVYEGTTTDSTNVNDLKDTEIELNDANISLDDGVIDTIGDKNVTVSADKLEGDDRKDLGLSKEELEQVGNSPIYNFTINDGTSNISQFGDDNWVTITLPYTLSEGEDVDSIAVWFINDLGELESIKATYNNGFVTFKTNHFSYYTVTRLTPAERCALYGHSHVVQHHDGSCTENSYDLYVCVRCHESYKANEVTAPGHKYVVETTPATCTQYGYDTHTCEVCNHSYKTKIKATGHDWKVAEEKTATCSENGFTKYDCANCEEEYTVTYEKLPHQLTVTKVDATCETNGYTLHDCDNCEYSYNTDYVAAFGHKYETIIWTWADDNSSATLTLVCSINNEHTVVLNANIGTSVINGVCSNYVKTTYTAAVEYKGVILSDVKVVETGSLEHNYSSEWSFNEDLHWHECLCGVKADEDKHNYENVTVIKEPTCTEAGESIATCICGSTKTIVVPATYEHNYVDGYCTMCQKAEGACDHKELHKVTVNLEEVGGCEGTIYYETCECGEVKLFDVENSDIQCDSDDNYEEGTFEDENGNVYEYMRMICDDCGLEVYATMFEYEEGCTEHMTITYNLTFKELKLENLVYDNSYTYHRNTGYINVDLGEHNCCAGYADVYACLDCGQYIYVDDVQTECDINFDEEPEIEIITDENGITKYVQKAECSICGLYVMISYWVEETSDCEGYEYHSMIFGNNEKIIIDITDVEHYENHNFEETIEKLGATCEDGIKITQTCTICNLTYSHTRYSHYSKYCEEELNDICCGGYIRGYRCVICNEFEDLFDFDLYCNFDGTTDSEFEDENGIVHYVSTETCPDCGLVLVYEMWEEQEDSCTTIRYRNYQVLVNNEELFSFSRNSYDTNHTYEETYVMLGETCEDGVEVTETCTTCGIVSTSTIYWHQTEHLHTDLSDYGLCGGEITKNVCTRCNLTTDTYVSDYCDWNLIEVNELEQNVYQCSHCNAIKYETYTESEKNDQCEIKITRTYSYYKDDVEIVTYTTYGYKTQHNMQYEFELYGTLCTDGYKVIRRCSDCDYHYEYESSNHELFLIYSYEQSDDCCENHMVEIYSCPCDSENEIKLDNTFVYNEGLGVYECENCSIVFAYNYQEVENGCALDVTAVAQVKIADAIVFEYTWDASYSNHNFADIVIEENNGIQTITTMCEKCSEVKSASLQSVELEDHDGIYYYDYTFTPTETLKYTIRSIADERDTFVELYQLIDGHLELIGADDDSGSNGQFKLSYILEAGNTYVYRIRFYNSHASGSIAFSLTVDESQESACNHDLESKSFGMLLNGSTSCEDGILTGNYYTQCGCFNRIYVSYSHNTYKLFSLNESNDYCEEHEIEIYGCACGYEYRRYLTGFDYNDETHTYYCNNCNLTYHQESDQIEDGCEVLNLKYITVSLSDEVLFSYTAEKTLLNHHFTTPVIETNNGVTSIMAVCDKCQEEHVLDFYSVELVENDGSYSYDFEFIPTETAQYVITGCSSEYATYVRLYELVDGELNFISSDSYSVGYGQFQLTNELEAGKTYIYRVSFDDSSLSGVLKFTFGKTYAIVDKCNHDYNERELFAELLEGSTSCEDGIIRGYLSNECGCFTNVYERYEHETFVKEYYDLTEFGACRGNVSIYACACDEITSVSRSNMCTGNYTSNEYYDEEGRLIHVNVRTCSTCDLRYTTSFYTEKDHENCELTYYYTIIINVGDTLVTQFEYTVVEEDHEYEITTELINGEGSTCNDGVIISYKCKDCDYEYTREEYYHYTYELERIELTELGSVCGGYAVINGCACGYHVSLNLDHSLCERGHYYSNDWIEGDIDSSQEQINGYNSFYTYINSYKCAVTDPVEKACTFIIRTAEYWVKDEGMCQATKYVKYQFGYDESTDSCAYELTFKLKQSKTYHNYTCTEENNGYSYDCDDCGSYYNYRSYYDENGRLTKSEYTWSNTLNNKQDKYKHEYNIYEYLEDYVHYTSEYYYTVTDCNNEVYWQKTDSNVELYTGTFGEPGRKETNHITDSNENSKITESAFVYYMDYTFRIYEYYEENDYWYRYDYTYSFDGECLRTSTYTNSNGESSSSTYNCCHFDHSVTIENATCTQSGLRCYQCPICGSCSDNQIIVPYGHSWRQLEEGWYCCRYCGLENANGVSGSIVMEDLTSKYGNGEYYVVGYYIQNNVEFTYYVSLIFEDQSEVVVEGIEFVTIDGIRAYAFSKAAVQEFANANNYTNYLVRFSFVPYGSDSSFDYGVTFTDDEKPEVITEDCQFTVELEAGQIVDLTITPDVDGTWTMRSMAFKDTYATLCDANGNYLTSDDDSGNNGDFKITYDLKAGETYILKVKFYSSSVSGPLKLNFKTNVE